MHRAHEAVIDGYLLVDLWTHARCLEDRRRVEVRLEENLFRFGFDAQGAVMELDGAVERYEHDEPIHAPLLEARNATQSIAHTFHGLRRVFPNHAPMIAGEHVPMSH